MEWEQERRRKWHLTYEDDIGKEEKEEESGRGIPIIPIIKGRNEIHMLKKRSFYKLVFLL